MRANADLYRPKRRRSARTRSREFEARLAQAEKEAKQVLLVSHGHCLDGVGSVIVALRGLGRDGVGVAYVQPSDMGRVLEFYARYPGRGRRLIIADLSLNPDQYDRIVTACAALHEGGWTIDWMDHHHKQWEDLDLSRLQEHLRSLVVNDDASESGASLAQRALAPKDTFAKRFADTVKDRDLWHNNTPDSELLELAITWMETDAFTEHFLTKKGRDKVVDDVILEAAHSQRRLVEEHTRILLDEARYFETSSGDKVAVVYGWLPKNIGLHRLLQEDGVRVAVNVRPNGKMSLRTDPDAPVAHLIARRFDGGGHPQASGGDLGLKGPAYWWYVARHGHVGRVQQVADAAVEELERLGSS